MSRWITLARVKARERDPNEPAVPKTLEQIRAEIEAESRRMIEEGIQQVLASLERLVQRPTEH